MAQVATSEEHRDARDRAGRYLDELERAWAGVSNDVVDWETWNDESRLTYLDQWVAPARQFRRVHDWAERGLLSPAESARYERVMVVVEKNQPLLNELFRKAGL